jgi:hypothetical protein
MLTRGAILTSQLLAGVAAAIGLVSLGEYLFGWDLGIDQLLFVDSPQEAIRSAGLGLMAPVNILNFFLLGLALILMSWTTLHNLCSRTPSPSWVCTGWSSIVCR